MVFRSPHGNKTFLIYIDPDTDTYGLLDQREKWTVGEVTATKDDTRWEWEPWEEFMPQELIDWLPER